MILEPWNPRILEPFKLIEFFNIPNNHKEINQCPTSRKCIKQ